MPKSRTSRSPKLRLTRVVKRRKSYAERSGQNRRQAQIVLSENRSSHFTHASIRQALMRQHVVERAALREELPDAAINYAVTKGWLHRMVGEDWFRVTTKAAADLELPAKNGEGRKVRFTDASKLPPSEAAFDAPKKVEVSAERAAAILAELATPAADLIAEALRFRAVLDETDWAPADLARRLGGDDKKQTRLLWNRIIMAVSLLTLDDNAQAAARTGRLRLDSGWEISRVDPAERPALLAAATAGASYAAIRRQVTALLAK
jgi:hypothetical protein